jgi:hypothetical protein
MVKNRSDFLEGLKARLDHARAEPARPAAATAPPWPVVPTVVEDDPFRSAIGEPGAADGDAPAVGEPIAVDSDAPAVGEPTAEDSDAPAVGGEWRQVAATTRQAARPLGLDDRPSPSAEGIGAAADSEPDYPKPARSWSERGMPERMRAAIASVRRISTSGRPDPTRHRPQRLGRWVAPDHRALRETFEEVARLGRTRPVTRREPPQQVARPGRTRPATRREPPGQVALWLSPEDESPVPIPATERRGIRIAALVVTTIVVLLVGSSLGLLLAGWNFELPSLPTGTAASPPEPVAESEAPTASPAPPPITEIVRVERAPVPPAATAEHPPPTATGAAPLPPPRPAPRSSSAGEGASATGPIDQALETLLEPVVEEVGSRPALRVFVHYAATAAGGPATAMHLVRHLKAQGFAVEAREVDFPIASYSIRYFFAADRDAAEVLSASLEGQVPGGGAPPVVDFTHSEPKPQEGHLELWIGA